MKKLIFFFVISIIAINCGYAQINTGSVLLGGDIGGSIQKTTKNGNIYTDQKGFIISPVYGKAIKENLIVGASLLFQYTEEKFPGTSNTTPEIKQSQPFYGIEFFVRKYRQIGSSSFYIFAEGGISAIYSSFNKDNSTTLEKFNSKFFVSSLYAYPGISYEVGKRLQIESGFINLLKVSYTHKKDIVTSTVTTTFITNSLGAGISLDNIAPLYIGFRVLLNK